MLETIFLNVIYSVSESRYWLGPLLLVDTIVMTILTVKEVIKNEN